MRKFLRQIVLSTLLRRGFWLTLTKMVLMQKIKRLDGMGPCTINFSSIFIWAILNLFCFIFNITVDQRHNLPMTGFELITSVGCTNCDTTTVHLFGLRYLSAVLYITSMNSFATYFRLVLLILLADFKRFVYRPTFHVLNETKTINVFNCGTNLLLSDNKSS